MNEKIICSYFKDEREVMDRVPYPGELGKKIYKEISKEAWQLWLEHQTMLINENRLSMVDPEARKYLQNEMKKFLFEGHSSKPTEYVPVQE